MVVKNRIGHKVKYQNVGFQGLRGEGNMDLLTNRHKVSVKIRWISSTDLFYNTEPMVNNNVLYISAVLRGEGNGTPL